HTYSLLTVGDGLIAQIPALLISVAAGTVVTRVNSGDGAAGELGTEIVRQLGASHRALSLTALILMGAAVLPGVAAAVFISLAVVLGGSAFFLRRRQAVDQAPAAVELDEAEAEQAQAVEPAGPLSKPLGCRLLLVLGPGLAASAPEQPLRQRIEAL